MNATARSIVRDACNQDARRRLARAGGYKNVEATERSISGETPRPTARRERTYEQLEARVADLERMLDRARGRAYALKRSRDMWRTRALQRPQSPTRPLAEAAASGSE